MNKEEIDAIKNSLDLIAEILNEILAKISVPQKNIYEQILLAEAKKNYYKLFIYTNDGNYYVVEGFRLSQIKAHEYFISMTAKKNEMGKESLWVIPYKNITAINYKTKLDCFN